MKVCFFPLAFIVGKIVQIYLDNLVQWAEVKKRY